MIFKLDDVCDFYNGGAWSDKEYVANGLPVLKVTNCKPQGFEVSDINYLPFSSAEKYQKNKLQLNDVVIATVGSHPNLVDSAAGRTCIINSLVDGFYLNQNAVCMRSKDNDILNQRYLGYLSQDRLFRHYIQMRGRGAANQMRIAISTIKSFEFDFPEITVQRRIADILSAYDNLIENNQKQIKLLEEAAQRLYKEWFVDLRFPGHEKVQIIDGIPAGWEKKSVADCLNMYIGGGWGKEAPDGKSVIPGKVIRGTDINDIKNGSFNGIPLRYHTESNLRTRTLSENDIVFELSNGNIDNIGRTLLIDNYILKSCEKNVICASFCKLFRPINRLHAILLFLEIQDMQSSGRMLPYKKQGSNGINNFAFEEFLQHTFLIPDENFSSVGILDNLISHIGILRNQISFLAEARNRLLPKLMSGEINF